jgi:hypothetical protein
MFKTAAAFAVANALMVGAASAAILFEDDFDRSNSNTVGNGWSELNNSSSDVAISGNRLLLRDELSGNPDAAAASATIDATGFENTMVSFTWTPLGPNSSNDLLKLVWSLASDNLSMTNEEAWSNVVPPFSVGSNGTNTVTASVGVGATDKKFRLMFWTDVSDADEGFYIDNVKVTGDPISAVPVPASLPLLVAGLAGFGLMRRRKS